MDVFLLTFLLAIIICAVIYLLHSNEEKISSIPIVTYKRWPILGHLIPFLRDRTTFLLECKKLYGQCFKIQLVNQNFILILSPSDWSGVLRNTSFYFPVDVHAKRLFDIPSQFRDHPDFDIEGHRQYTQYLKNRDGLQALLTEFVRRLRDRMHNEKLRSKKTDNTFEWMSIGLLEFSRRLIFEPSTLALFGEIDPISLEKDFRLFDDSFHYFSSGFPQWIYSLVFSKEIQARRRLNESWLKNDQPNREPEFMLARKQLFDQHSHWFSKQDLGGSQTGLFWGSLGNTIPAVFWCLFYILRDSNAVKAIQQEIDKNLPYFSLDDDKDDSIIEQWTTEQLNSCVYLESAVNEMLRLVGAAIMTRICDRDTQIVLQDGRSFVVKPNETVAYFAPTTHLDENLFPQANQFVFDRFLNKTPDKIPGFMPFGGGKSMCPGRFFAKNEIKICLALLLRYIDYKFIDKDIIPKQKAQRVGFGVAPPNIDVPIMYRYK